MGVVALAVLFAVGCASSSGSCERAAFWDKEWKPKAEYAQALYDAFHYADNGKPQTNPYVAERLNDLEKFCYQLRMK